MNRITPRKFVIAATAGTILTLSFAVVAAYNTLRYQRGAVISADATDPAALSDIAPAAGPAKNPDQPGDKNTDATDQ